jgi:hypothetical protein
VEACGTKFSESRRRCLSMHRTQVFEVFNQHAVVPEQQRMASTSRPADVCGCKGQQACGAGAGERRGGGDERARRRSSWEVAHGRIGFDVGLGSA